MHQVVVSTRIRSIDDGVLIVLGGQNDDRNRSFRPDAPEDTHVQRFSRTILEQHQLRVPHLNMVDHRGAALDGEGR